jgi:hypothetical protein
MAVAVAVAVSVSAWAVPAARALCLARPAQAK